MDCKVISKKGLETKFDAEERYPEVAKPLTVDCKEAEEMYPSVPNPCVVLPRLLTKLRVPNPTTVEVSSVVSIKEDIKFCKPMVVLWRLLANVKLLTKFAADER